MMIDTKLVRSMLGLTLAFLLGSNAYMFWQLHRLGGEVSRWEQSVAQKLAEFREVAARCAELSQTASPATISQTGNADQDRNTDGTMKVSRARPVVPRK